MCQIEEGYGSVKLVVSGFTVWNCLYIVAAVNSWNKLYSEGIIFAGLLMSC